MYEKPTVNDLLKLTSTHPEKDKTMFVLVGDKAVPVKSVSIVGDNDEILPDMPMGSILIKI